MTTDQLDAAIAATQRLAASTAHRLALEHLIPDDATPETMRALVAEILDDAGREIVMCEETIATLRAKHADFVREVRDLAKLAGAQNVDALGDSVIVQRAAIAIGQTTTQLASELERNRALDGAVAKLRARVAELEAETRVSDQRLADQHDKWSALVADLESRLTAAIADRDNARHERDMAIANRDGLLVERDAVARELDELRAEIGELRTERDAGDFARAKADETIAELRARPVLTVERLAEALSTGMARRVDPGEVLVTATLAALGPVTLPTPDRAEDVVRMYFDAFADMASKDTERRWSCSRWDDVEASRRPRYVAAMSAALAKLPPNPAPSKPADVFAGVSLAELARAFDEAGESAPSLGRMRAGIAAVLDALRVKLVAPVDPEAVAGDYYNRRCGNGKAWDMIDSVGRARAGGDMRATLIARGIPVTPEAGK